MRRHRRTPFRAVCTRGASRRSGTPHQSVSVGSFGCGGRADCHVPRADGPRPTRRSHHVPDDEERRRPGPTAGRQGARRRSGSGNCRWRRQCSPAASPGSPGSSGSLKPESRARRQRRRSSVTTTVDDGPAAKPALCPGSTCSLRDAILYANANPGTTISVPSGVFMLNGTQLSITAGVTVVGAGAGASGTVIEQQAHSGSRVVSDPGGAC